MRTYSDRQRLLDQNPIDIPAEECSHRDDPGHDHEQCLEAVTSIRARVATRPSLSSDGVA